jgi:GDP/UDP-N,N'-diacetylbacillosamine 2-epimerase (hydrolysing)
MKRKICVITGSRAEYGLLKPLIDRINKDPFLELQVIATGMHLSPDFGLTYREIEKDGIEINRKVDIQLLSDTPLGISKSAGLAVIGLAEALEELKPDIAVLLGDRYEIFAAASAALFLKVPLAHIHGGETTEGAFDEALRHSITKMSHLHFTSTEDYRRCVIQMGEDPERVFNVGAIGLDNIRSLKLLSRDELEKAAGIRFGKRNLLVTFHPVTLEENTAGTQFRELLDALDTQKDTRLIFTKANSDTDGRVINRMIDEYVSGNNGKAIAFTSMGRLNYLSAMQYADAVVGNSSSGIIEAPSLKTGTINIGDRQKGRIKARSVIDCPPEKNAVSKALDQIYSEGYREMLSTVKNPYDNGGASERILEFIKNRDLKGILKKKFYDIKFDNH